MSAPPFLFSLAGRGWTAGPKTRAEGIMQEADLQHWALLYNNCLAETDPLKLQSLIVALEEAISHRLRELNGKAGAQHETLALETAANNVQKIKTTKLGFPAA